MNRFALAIMRGLGPIGRWIRIAGKPLWRVLAAVANVIARLVVLPVYKIILMLRIRFARLLLSARGVVFLLFTNRYVFHTVLIIICVATIGSQLRAKNATAGEAGQSSLLYALVTNGQDEIIEEEVRPELLAKNADYLGADTIQGLPNVDYDYSDEEQPLADLTVPGAIAVQPGSEQPGLPGEAVIVRTKTETYTVADGDTVGSIARRFGVNVGTIVWANNLGKNAFIKPGDALKIPPVSGILHVVKKGDTIDKLAQVYDAKTDEILAGNHLAPNHTLALGEELVIPGGTPPVPVAVAKPKTIVTRPGSTPLAVRSDVPLSKIKGKSLDVYQELTKPDTRVKPKDEVVDETVPQAKLLWPTHLHVINQYYGWKHTGVDIDGDYVDPIYAAADGVVTKAGWNSGGYGLMILIDHKNGYVTRYGHASKLFVKEGDMVKRGQVIAMVGTTGRSTGTHLHFEVYVNGKRVNPLAYIK